MNPKIELKKGGRKIDDKFIAYTGPSQDNRITNAKVKRGELPQSALEIYPQGSPTITADSLKAPVSPFKLTTPQVPTLGSQLGAEIQGNQDAFTANLAQQQKTAEANLKASKDPYATFLAGLQGEQGLTDQAYSQAGGVDDVQTELNDINAQINAEVQAETRRQQALDKNPQGLFGGALEQEKARINRDSIAKQADLSVIQMAKQGRYDSAKAIADRAVSAKLEGQRILGDKLKFDYEENKDLFTKAESRTFESAYADRNRRLDAEEANLKEISDLSLQALADGAPTSIASQMRAAKTVEEAMRIGGQYVGLLDRQAKQASIANAYSAIAERNKTPENPNGTINGKPQNVTQAAANGYADRIAQANVSIQSLGSKFTGDLAIGGGLPNFLQSGDRQAYEQAKKNFATAVLRRESGASIAPSEFETLNSTYFPVRGDDEKVIQQKEDLRNTVINSFYREANMARPVLGGEIIEDDDGNKYRVGLDGETLEPIE